MLPVVLESEFEGNIVVVPVAGLVSVALQLEANQKTVSNIDNKEIKIACFIGPALRHDAPPLFYRRIDRHERKQEYQE